MTASVAKRVPWRERAARTAFGVATGATMVSGLYTAATYARPGSPRRGALREWGVAAWMSAARPLGIPGPLLHAQADRARPVVLAHGYAMSRACFRWFGRRLGRSGFGPVYGFEYWSPGGVREAAGQLAEFCERVARAAGVDDVDVVGHSMGGLVARYYVQRLGGDRRVPRLVTIGSPHRGVDDARFAWGRARRDLVPHTRLWQNTAAQRSARTRIVSIASRDDALVPAAATVLEGAESIVFDGIGHLSLLTSRAVVDAVCGVLRE